MSKNKCVLGLVRVHQEAEDAVNQLKAAGFRMDAISVLFPDRNVTRDFAHEKHTKAPEGAAIGAGTGGVVGGTLGLLAGIGALAIPGLGPFIAAGPIMATLAGAGAGSAVGGLTGALVGLGIPEMEAKQYEGKVKEGSVLISVHLDDKDDEKRAKEILKNCGATDVATAGEKKPDEKTSDRDRRYPPSSPIASDPVRRY